MAKPRETYSCKLRPEAAEIVDGALEPGESPASFTAKALVLLALKRKNGKWPKAVPAEALPRSPGRQPKTEDSAK